MRTITAALAVAVLLAAGGVASPPRVTATTSTAKVVIIVGPTGSVTSTYRSEGDAFYNEALKYTPNVVRVYSPNATWAAVTAAVQGASVVVYLGHGNGFPNPYSSTLNTSSNDGFGLNATANNGDSNTAYYGEYYIRNYVHLAPNAVVIFNHACYTAGSSEPGYPDPTVSIAEQRIDNYASGFQAAGASAVFATAFDYAYRYIDALFGTSQSLDSMWRHLFDAQGNFFSFASTRTPGTTDESDPTSTGLYYRALSGKIGTSTTTVVNPVPDTTAPTVSAPRSRIYAPSTMAYTATPVATSWTASDPSGIASYTLERMVNGGAWAVQSLASATSSSIVQSLSFGSTYRYVVRATDGAGNTSGWFYGPYFRPSLTDQTSAAIAWSGTWTSVANSYASGGSLRYTTASGASASYTFSGSSVAWLAYRGPDRGNALVYVDGTLWTNLSLYSATYASKQLVFDFDRAANGTHTIKIVNLATAGHPRIDLDAFVLIVQS